MRLVATIAATAILALMGTGAMAQTTTPATATTPAATATQSTGTAMKPKAAAPAAKMSADKTAVSKACSAQADAKGLHGKDREKFRSTCKKNGGKS